jgi:hypothetical protein
VEYALYSDCAITGEVSAGPYAFINTIPAEVAIGLPTCVLVLRADMHISEGGPDTIDDLESEDVKDYYAGDLDDELAALLSLAMGCRVRSGGATRRGVGNDERGTPFEFDHHPPALVAPHRAPMLPAVADPVDLAQGHELLDRYSRLGINDARALVRAARQYEEALWIADADPRIAWIKLISALDTAASRWERRTTRTAVEQLRSVNPELATYLAKVSEQVEARVAQEIAHTLKVTDKFIRFTLAFAPDPPPKRPPPPTQFDWSAMANALRVLYDWRSKDLHDGLPFPGPLCSPPNRDADTKTPWEAFPALAAAGYGGRWPKRRLPMYLHLFEHIAGGALRAWWASL